MKIIWSSLALLMLCTACASSPTFPQCPAKRQSWIQSPGSIAERGDKGSVYLAPDGSLMFNGLSTDFSGLEDYLDELRRRDASWVQIHPEAGADCDQLEAVRDAVERRFNCHDGNCLEWPDGEPTPPPGT